MLSIFTLAKINLGAKKKLLHPEDRVIHLPN